jgi:hopanoid biosynthesis associated protein HpnK
LKRVIFTADDFGLSEGVNEAVEQAHREGLLSTASLMIGGPAAHDAIRRAKALPSLRVGLHVVVIEGASVRPGAVRGLVDAAGNFSADQVGASVGYYFAPRKRQQLATEIRSQFSAFQKTGLRLDHANAHKHMQMHPVIGRLMVRIGKEFGLPAIRIPREPAGPMRRSGTAVGWGGQMLNLWSDLLRARALRAGLQVNDTAFGIAWSGHMTTDRLLRLVPHLPDGLNEIYFHPAARRDRRLEALMPDYEHEAELATLLSPDLRAALDQAGVQRTTFGPT